MVKRAQTNRRLLPTNCLIVFDHFVGLALKGLIGNGLNQCCQWNWRKTILKWLYFSWLGHFWTLKWSPLFHRLPFMKMFYVCFCSSVVFACLFDPWFDAFSFKVCYFLTCYSLSRFCDDSVLVCLFVSVFLSSCMYVCMYSDDISNSVNCFKCKTPIFSTLTI